MLLPIQIESYLFPKTWWKKKIWKNKQAKNQVRDEGKRLLAWKVLSLGQTLEPQMFWDPAPRHPWMHGFKILRAKDVYVILFGLIKYLKD